ncbi:hypothetical protein EYF80_042914 [Liparis tanakae]|uniref:Uncharacterized protein n=1 Tax=Liparis tanakae TaxID=230148 RepID=A0A4Z2FZY7_9TELE|nr:hypothetical protein EYF80_042914 [Liparis tanakae]
MPSTTQVSVAKIEGLPSHLAALCSENLNPAAHIHHVAAQSNEADGLQHPGNMSPALKTQLARFHRARESDLCPFRGQRDVWECGESFEEALIFYNLLINYPPGLESENNLRRDSDAVRDPRPTGDQTDEDRGTGPIAEVPEQHSPFELGSRMATGKDSLTRVRRRRATGAHKSNFRSCSSETKRHDDGVGSTCPLTGN